MSATLPVVDDGRAAGEADALRRREGAIRAGVLAALGRPPGLYRLAVVALWGDYYRVNVVTGSDPTAVLIPHSYFVEADDRGNVLTATPKIQRTY